MVIDTIVPLCLQYLMYLWDALIILSNALRFGRLTEEYSPRNVKRYLFDVTLICEDSDIQGVVDI